MAVYDTHAHVFPSVRERLQDQLPPSLLHTFDEWVKKSSVPPGFSALKTYWVKWLQNLESKGKSIDIETVAGFQTRFHPQMFKVIEGLISAVLGPTQMLQGSTANLLESMATNQIDKTVIIASSTSSPNDWILDQAAEHPSLIPVVSLPLLAPTSTLEDYGRELERLMERGAKGFKIHTNFDNLTGENPAYRAYFETARAHSKFIILHTGCFHVPQYKNPACPTLSEFEHFFQEFPEVRVCLAHMNRENPEEAWVYMKRYDQVFADTSWQTSANIRQAQSAVGHDRILLGSDWPLLHKNLQANALDVLRQALSDNQVEQIMGRNAEVFLGLD